MSKNSNCEDAINIVDSKGLISNISINNSESDSLDLDFSDIEIKKISISNSKNDCVDVSGGNYNFQYLDLKNCGDKGLSVGENSIVNLEEIKVNHSSIGVASKDSSKTIIEKFSGDNLLFCLSAYNKKQEFDGGEIFVKNYNCTNKTFRQDKISNIVIE